MTNDAESALEETARRAQAQLNYNTATVPFYVALGRFLHQYLILESVMLAMLINVSGVSHQVGKSIYSGTRVGAAKDLINRILDATNRRALKSRLKPYFDQIGLITSMRDEILHYGAVYDHDKNVLIVSNERVAHIPSRVRTYEVNPEILNDLAHDTGRAICGFIIELATTAEPEKLAYFREQIASPWRYKPPPPIPLPPETR